MIEDKSGTIRIDDTGFGGIRVLQRPGFGYGVDSVLLAAFASGETGARAMDPSGKAADLGTGCGIIAFIAAHKNPGVTVIGIEKRPDAYERASEACEMNGLTDRVGFICGDVNDIACKHDFDTVLSNPPYFRRQVPKKGTPAGTLPQDADDRFIARHETTADIGGFVRAASGMLRRGGSFYLVHRPDRLVDIITEMRHEGIEPKELQMVVPSAGQAANIVLIHGIKDAGPELRILPEITVHTEDGGYTEEILRMYERL